MTRLKPSAETLGSLQPRGDAVRAPQPSPTSRATRWLRAGGAPSGRYRSPSRFNLVPTPFRFPEPNQFTRLSAHWSSDPVTLSRLSDRRKPPPCAAWTAAQERHPWDWWGCLHGDHGGRGRLFLSPPMTVRSEGSIVPSGLWTSSCSKACPWRQDGCRPAPCGRG